MRLRHALRCLLLAERERQWRLDASGAALRDAVAEEQSAKQAEMVAEAKLSAAGLAQAEMLARPTFGAQDWVHHERFVAASAAAAQRAEDATRAAADDADRVRHEMKQTLSERDAFQERSKALRDEQQSVAARLEGRQLDEIYSARSASLIPRSAP